jgi:hypothetical protein
MYAVVDANSTQKSKFTNKLYIINNIYRFSFKFEKSPQYFSFFRFEGEKKF